MARLSEDVRKKLIEMILDGARTSEIVRETGVTDATVGYYRKKLNVPSPEQGKGGVVSRTIPIIELEKSAKKESVQEDDEEDSVVLVDQTITLCGTTMTKYTIHNGVVAVEGEALVGEFKVEKLNDIIKELKSVAKMATKMKQNRFDVV